MLTREVAEAHLVTLREALIGPGRDSLFTKMRMFDPRGIELLDFEIAEYDSRFFARLLLVERTSGRRGHVDVPMGPVGDQSYGTEEYVRAENVLEDLSQSADIVWE